MRAIIALGVLLCAAGPVMAEPVLPDPSHVPFKLPKDIKWSGDENSPSQSAPLFGDPSKPGLYGMLIKWHKGHFSRPHTHSTDRYAYIISGTWWIGSTDTVDPDKAYPMTAGTLVINKANQVHWDGAKDTDVIFEMVGMGPMVTTMLDEKK